MTRSTHLPHPSPAEVRALLEAAGLSAYAAAKTLPLGVNARSLQQSVSGERAMSGPVWQLLKVCLSASARAELPETVLP